MTAVSSANVAGPRYTPGHWVPFPSPLTTRRATVEVFYPNAQVHFSPFSCPTVKDEIRRYSSHYSDRLRTHPNHLAVSLLRLPDTRRLRQFLPNDLPDRF
jgi:hypothetical protein